MPLFHGAELVGGIAFILFGLGISREGMQTIAGERLKLLMTQLAGRRIWAVGIDTLAAMALQSTRAVIQFALDFVKGRLMTLAQALAVSLGAETGTALVILLLSCRWLTDVALYLIAAGFVAERLTRSERLRQLGATLLGLGLIFFGMHLLYVVIEPLGSNATVRSVLALFGQHPTAVFLIATVLTLLVRSTAVAMAFAIALASSGALPLAAGLVVVLGANLGSALTLGRRARRRGLCGRRLALFHTAVNVAGLAVALPLVAKLSAWAATWAPPWLILSTDEGTLMATGIAIALAHVAFNMALAILFVPLTGVAARLSERLISGREEEEPQDFVPKFLDEDALDTPMLAFAQARREVYRISKIAREMFKNALEPFRMDVDFDGMVEMAGEADDKIDALEKAVRFFLARIPKQNHAEAQVAQEVALLTIAQAIEDIGDTIQRDLMGLARRKRRKLARFSDEGLGELRQLHQLVHENFELAMMMLVRPHEEIARKMARHEKRLDELEQELRQSHLLRLHQGLPESCETSTIHLDILNCFRLINFKLAKIVETAAELA